MNFQIKLTSSHSPVVIITNPVGNKINHKKFQHYDTLLPANHNQPISFYVPSEIIDVVNKRMREIEKLFPQEKETVGLGFKERLKSSTEFLKYIRKNYNPIIFKTLMEIREENPEYYV